MRVVLVFCLVERSPCILFLAIVRSVINNVNYNGCIACDFFVVRGSGHAMTLDC